MSKIIVIGSMNMDLVISADRTPKKGETIKGHSFATIPGGKGANQAVACARTGGNCYMAAKIGADSFGTELLKSLRESGVNTDYVKTCEGINTGVAVITIVDGDNTIILSEGANGLFSVADIEVLDDFIKDSAAILLQHEIPLDTISYIIKKYKGITKIFLNPAPMAPISDEVLEGLDFFTPNQTETEELSGIKVKDRESAFEALDFLIAKGVKYPIITLGGLGAAYFDGETKKICPAFKTSVVDTTAAGDTFTGAFAASFVSGKSMDEAIRFAQMAASITVTKYGAQSSIPDYEAVVEGLKKYDSGQ